jgi:hypothetical protein
MRSWVQVPETSSCRNAGKGCVHKTQSGRTLPQGPDPTQTGATCTELPLCTTILGHYCYEHIQTQKGLEFVTSE